MLILTIGDGCGVRVDGKGTIYARHKTRGHITLIIDGDVRIDRFDEAGKALQLDPRGGKRHGAEEGTGDVRAWHRESAAKGGRAGGETD